MVVRKYKVEHAGNDIALILVNEHYALTPAEHIAGHLITGVDWPGRFVGMTEFFPLPVSDYTIQQTLLRKAGLKDGFYSALEITEHELTEEEKRKYCNRE